MGAHTNYYLLVEFLLSVKQEFFRIELPKFQDLITELKKFPYDPDLENNEIPDCDELAKKLGFKKAKVQKLLKELRSKILEDFYWNPLQIKRVEQTIFISIPYDEVKQAKAPDYKDYARENSLSISVKMPFTPRIGERINLSSFNKDVDFNNGYVYKIDHEITPNVQRVFIWVHPFKDYYHHWMKMKKNFEDHKLWIKMIRSY